MNEISSIHSFDKIYANYILVVNENWIRELWFVLLTKFYFQESSIVVLCYWLALSDCVSVSMVALIKIGV